MSRRGVPRGPWELVVLGASLGGMEALSRVLSPLPEDFPPVVVVQHRPRDSGPGMADFLARHTALAVEEADDKAPLAPGRLYLAPADYHLLVEPGRLALSTGAPVSFARPSIDVLFESAAHAYGPSLAGVLLTAASEDGASGLAAIHRAGGEVVVQDPATARSPIAPRAALRRTPSARVLPLAEIGPYLRDTVASRRRHGGGGRKDR